MLIQYKRYRHHSSGQWVAWGKGECTINEHALDVFSINTVEKTIKAVRIGRGQNRNWSYNSN